MSDELRVTLPVRLSELRDLATMVEDFGEANNVSAPKVFAINLELDELITNTVTHGSFEAGVDPRIDIHLKVEYDILTLTMEDNGSPFDPTLNTDPDTAAPLEARNVGGLGLHLVKNFASRISYEFVGGKNRLTLEHDLKLA